MIEKQEAIRILEGFQRYYDKQNHEAFEKYQCLTVRDERSACKEIACYAFKRRLRENKETDIFKIIQQFKDHYEELIKTDEAMEDIKLRANHTMMLAAIKVLEKRFRTIEKNKLRKEGAS